MAGLFFIFKKSLSRIEKQNILLFIFFLFLFFKQEKF